MKIVIFSLNFYPEYTGIGKYTGEMARWLVERGHNVTVITAPPYYPEWKIRSGYSNLFWSREYWGGIKIWRCPIWVPSHPSGVRRVIHLASFAISSLPILLLQIFFRPNIIWSVEPPFFISPASLFYAWITGAKSVLHIQDFEVDAAIGLGLIRGKLLKTISLMMEGFFLKKYSLVSTISAQMLRKACDKGVKASKLVLFKNWVDNSVFLEADKVDFKNVSSQSYRTLLNIPDGALIALYSGNMGAKQGLHLLSDVAKKFESSASLAPFVYFVFCGDGMGRSGLMRDCFGLDNVCFLDLQPPERLGKLLCTADIHLLPQKSVMADLVMPSKLSGILASGRPVLACADEGTELAQVVTNCGIFVDPNDPVAFYEGLIKLASDEDLRQSLGANAKQYAKANLDMDLLLADYESQLISLIGNPSDGRS